MTLFAVINSVPGSNYTQFQIKVWDVKLGKSRVYSDELYPTRIEAKRAADDDPKLTRVDSFRVARERTEESKAKKQSPGATRRTQRKSSAA